MENKTKHNTKRRTLGLLSAIVLAHAPLFANTALAQGKNEANTTTLRIGFQKYGTLTLLKGTGALDKRLAERGISVKWSEFPAGPQLLEGLNVGSIDFGTTGEAPPIFAQAAGADLVYVANEPPAPQGEAIIVAKDSTIKAVSELKGKKIALNKGSNVHYLLVNALQRAGVGYHEVQTIFLPPADARAAFERGSVDAWAIWDPFLAAAEKQLGARTLSNGVGIVKNHQFYLASRTFAQKNPEVIRIIIEELLKTDEWGSKNLKEVTEILSAQIGLEPSIVELSARRLGFGVKVIDEQVIQEQQKIANTFFDLKLIPKPVQIKDAVWSTVNSK